VSKDTVLELRRLADKMAGTTAVIVFNSTLRDAADEIERLRAERDEARRLICDLSWEDSKEVAAQLGWDCFKEAQ
jgi:hypothetical protein